MRQGFMVGKQLDGGVGEAGGREDSGGGATGGAANPPEVFVVGAEGGGRKRTTQQGAHGKFRAAQGQPHAFTADRFQSGGGVA